MSYDYSQHSKEGLVDMLEESEHIKDLRKQHVDFQQAVAEDEQADKDEIIRLQENLKTAMNIIEEKNAAIMELKRNKGIPEMQKALADIALVCNAELYEVEQVARRDLAEAYQQFYDIQKLADEALK